jgi:hypothetical protein
MVSRMQAVISLVLISVLSVSNSFNLLGYNVITGQGISNMKSIKANKISPLSMSTSDDALVDSVIKDSEELIDMSGLPIVDSSPDSNVTDIAIPTRQLTWNAAVKSSVRVKENGRTVEEYMRLPASEYSVLSAAQIIRISDTEFKCELPTMNFFGTKIQPLLFVDVNVYPEFNRSEIIVRRAETTGSEAALTINGTFSINAVNIVSAGTDDKGRKTLNSDTKLDIVVQVPASKFPLRVIQSGGNFIMQSSLNIIVPTFVRILSSDFQRWSAGNNSRDAVEGATLSTS